MIKMIDETELNKTEATQEDNKFHYIRHEKKTTGKYTVTDKVKQCWENSIKNLNTGIEENKIYWDTFSKVKFASKKAKDQWLNINVQYLAS